MRFFFVIFACCTLPDETVSDESAQLVMPIVAVQYRTAHQPENRCHCLNSDYGFYINWSDHTAPDIRVYEKNAKVIRSLSTAEELLDWLRSVPEEEAVHWVKTCGSTTMGMPLEANAELQHIIEKRKLCIKEGFGICTCESIERRFFRNLKEALDWMDTHQDAEYIIDGKNYCLQFPSEKGELPARKSFFCSEISRDEKPPRP